ncbi:MAG: hypothetical protein CYG60_06675 [Actinobacteria bacterium]|jgi:hypothetical protein|nr:MAG: hypothetical protein CYG60_06675 [Actinomycetota bacterium]
MGRKVRKELQDPEVFEGALREETEISSEFALPISVLALRVEGGWSEEATRRALDALRTADLVCQPEPEETLIALPNTVTDDARVVEERLREAVPEAIVGIAPFARGDTVESLIERARVCGGPNSS